jgi:hypothetical protein
MPRPACLLLAVLGFVAAAGLSSGQTGQLKPFRLEAKQPSDPNGRFGQLREGRLNTRGPDLKANQALFKDVARFHVYRCTDEKYYATADTGDLKARETSSTFDQVLTDVTGAILQPGPETKYTTVQQDFNTEFGVALNEAIRDVLKTNPPSPIRINCGRLLALASKSGAPALAPTVHELLTDAFPLDKGKAARTPPDLLVWAIRAAGNLFAAYEPVWHLNTDWRTQYRHSFELKDQVALVADLQTMLTKGPNVAEFAAPPEPDKAAQRFVRPDGTVVEAGGNQAKLDNAAGTPEQAMVVQYFRRQVCTALCKVRPDVLGLVGQPPVRPGVDIARIAVNDSRLPAPVTTPEVAEAVIGLCYLAPSDYFNTGEALNAVATGLLTLVRVYDIRLQPNTTRYAKIIPWRVYAERLNAAMDHLARQANSNPRWQKERSLIQQLAAAVRDDVVAPLRQPENLTARPSANRLDEIVASRRGLPPAGRSLYTDKPDVADFRLTPR